MSERYDVSVQFGTTDETQKDESEHSEFERFESLTHDLLTVSKDELDEKRAESAELPHPRSEQSSS